MGFQQGLKNPRVKHWLKVTRGCGDGSTQLISLFCSARELQVSSQDSRVTHNDLEHTPEHRRVASTHTDINTYTQTKKRCKEVYKRFNNTNSVACAEEKWLQYSGLTRASTPSCWCSRVIVERGASKNVRARRAVKCSPLGRTQSVWPWFHSSCGSLHRTCIRLDLTSVKHPWERGSWALSLPAELLATVGLWGMLSCYI